jgi:cellulose synthase/poly-beta-1,6-N-acetylglucosamine synthase-like glycosyltransferase
MMAAIWSPIWIVGAMTLVAGTLAAAAGVYLLVLAVAAFAYRDPKVETDPTSRLVVLVPAHNEADLIQRCVASLRAQQYPAARFRIVVIADNCTDETALLAKAAGAEVLAREAPEARGKGHALRWAMDRLISSGPERPDAFVVIDGDSVAERGLLRGLVNHLESGAEAVQAQYLVMDDDESPRVQLRSVAFLLFHRVRFAGRAVLHLPCALVGNGMLFRRQLLERHPWDAFTGAEDLEYSLTLRRAGVRPVFAGSAVLRGPVPASGRSAQVQRERWEGGRLHVLRSSLPELVRDIVIRRRVSVVDVALDLMVPPLGLLAAGTLGGTVLVLALWGGGLVPLWLLAPWLIAMASIGGFVMLGLLAAHAPAWMYRRLVSAPLFLCQKLLGTVGVLRHRATEEWVRTERPSEIAS